MAVLVCIPTNSVGGFPFLHTLSSIYCLQIFGSHMLSYSAVVCRFVTPRTVAHQAPLSMGLLRQEYWSGFPFPPQEDLLDPGIEPASPELKVDSLPLWHLGCPASSRLNTNSSGRHSFTHWTRSHKFFYFLSSVAKHNPSSKIFK